LFSAFAGSAAATSSKAIHVRFIDSPFSIALFYIVTAPAQLLGTSRTSLWGQ
jgi:hypothetical protein